MIDFNKQREMNTKFKIFSLFAVMLMAGISGAHAATKCSIANLTRCLDSACAINVSSNPAARCQYCGTSSAGEPTKGGMRSVSAGASAKYNISDKELKKAPTDPGERYAWATKQCLSKVAGCTPDDVTDNYDKLIEQSCKAAGISSQMSELATKANKKSTKPKCKTDIESCMLADVRCGANFVNCETPADFDKFFSECSVDATGCDEFTSEIRTDLASARDSAIENADELLASIVAGYQKKRDDKLTNARAQCDNGSGKEQCIENICNNTMRNKCDAATNTGNAERAIATTICKFHDIACDVLE